MRYNTETFISKAKEIHGDKFTYDKVEYKGSREKVTVTCRVHGDFDIEPASLLRGTGCKKCSYSKPSAKKYTKDFVLTKFNEVHGDQYDYSKFNYVNAKTQSIIICKEHGEFLQTPQLHMNGSGCPECGKKKARHQKTTEEFIEDAIKIHGNRYDYSKVNYTGADKDVVIICKEHGEFVQNANGHLRGNGCPMCSYIARGEAKKLTNKEIIDSVKSISGNSRELVNEEVINPRYINRVLYINVMCEKHGLVQVGYNSFLRSGRCPKCNLENRISSSKKPSEKFIEDAIKIHGNRYDYSKVDYVNAHTKVVIGCNKHGYFEQTPNQHLKGHGCKKCGNQTSKGEDEINDYLRSIGVNTIEKNRTILGGKGIDIYLPDFKIGIEFNGLIWHSEKFGKSEKYHLDKTESALVNGVRLIHIFEDEWVDKSEIIKSMLGNMLSKSDKIFARKCVVKEISSVDARDFCVKNHLKGFTVGSVHLGLFYKSSLISYMSFAKPRVNMGQKEHGDGVYELLRFCNKLGYSVIGGASKLLSYFEKNYKPKKVYSYSDRRYSEGELYLKLGFTYVGNSRPGYFYTRNGQFRENRFKFRKSELVKHGANPNLSEREIMKEKGYYRIYDCGTNKFEKEYN